MCIHMYIYIYVCVYPQMGTAKVFLGLPSRWPVCPIPMSGATWATSRRPVVPSRRPFRWCRRKPTPTTKRRDRRRRESHGISWEHDHHYLPEKYGLRMIFRKNLILGCGTWKWGDSYRLWFLMGEMIGFWGYLVSRQNPCFVIEYPPVIKRGNATPPIFRWCSCKKRIVGASNCHVWLGVLIYS